MITYLITDRDIITQVCSTRHNNQKLVVLDSSHDPWWYVEGDISKSLLCVALHKFNVLHEVELRYQCCLEYISYLGCLMALSEGWPELFQKQLDMPPLPCSFSPLLRTDAVPQLNIDRCS